MKEAHLSVSWDAYQKNICGGLSLLQQRGEFVDMTLAADGHHVKVHQMVLSLVSPYIKDLISTAQCPHPVIFLNNISYTTLHSILEYVYTGEVQVPKEQLSDLIAAGRALHIKGLQAMDNTITFPDDTSFTPLDNDHFDDTENPTITTSPPMKEELNEHNENRTHSGKIKKAETSLQPICKIFVDDDKHSPKKGTDDECTDMEYNSENQNEKTLISKDAQDTAPHNKDKALLNCGLKTVQYSLSNQGGLQIIVNRYIYTLKYVQKNMIRSWRCAEHALMKCRAIIYTCEKNNVIKRLHSHNHPLHDKKILKKISRGIVFSAYNEAEIKAQAKNLESKARDKKTDKKKESVGSHQPPKQDDDSD